MSTRIKDFLIIILAVIIIAALAVFLPKQAPAHDFNAAATPEEARVYKFYDSWYRPPNRQFSCCHRSDCHVVDVKREDGRWFFFDPSMQLWRFIPEDRLEHNAPDARESPDGRNHVCYNTMYVLCAVLGSGQ